ncbi:MAG: M15 family metallopeptidase [Pseudanabaenaceae cyanobacterium]
MSQDIPIAPRLSASKPKPSPILRSLQVLPGWVYALFLLAFLSPAGWWGWSLARQRWTVVPPEAAPRATSSDTSVKVLPTGKVAMVSPGERAKDVSPAVGRAAIQIGNRVHYAYAEAPAHTLEVIARASDGYALKLRRSAALRYREMVAAAAQEGIFLVPLSAFRSIDEQKELFFRVSENRNQTKAERALTSAPAGYSEHHTGYAVDLGDGDNPSTHFSPDFAKTAAFRWLEQNAPRYSFELSFPPGNPQGVAYEPWHWRFTGDQESLETFFRVTRP